MEYLVVIEKGPSSFGAYVPDLPGLGVVGRSIAEVKKLVKTAIELHVAGLREDGLPIPRATAIPHKVLISRRQPRRPAPGSPKLSKVAAR